MSINYNEMVSAIYAGQAIERLPLSLDKINYTIEDITNALGGNSVQIKKIRELLSQDYSDSQLDSKLGFTYFGAVAAIKYVAPAVLKYYGPNQ